ncbi:MAG: type I methionyl aminopeptidase [Nitrospiraceae bacterium]|nr:type I methionyl aminopeptidase [Nitrospiraceae bacterium]
MILVKSADEIALMAEAGRIVAETLEELKGEAAPGVSTIELERLAEGLMVKKGGKPAFKGYRGYPASICASVNDQVVHGIPSERKLKDGDILSIDLGVYYKGYYGDAALTVAVGSASAEALRLMRVTEESLWLGIAQAVEGNRVSDISNAVQRHVEANGFSVVRTFVGHGIGRQLHEEPQVPNFGPPGKGARLARGMALAIEPMVNAGGWRVNVLDDGWTAVTADRSLSAHYEHTVIVTDGEPKILTKLTK